MTLDRPGGTLLLALAALATAGCFGAEDPFPTLQRDLTFEHDGQERSYHFYQAEQPGPRPLVVLLHGGYATIDAFIGESSGGAAPLAGVFLELAQGQGFHVLIPQGLQKHWNDCRTDCEGCGQDDDAGFLLALIDQISTEVQVDGDHVHMAGESNGGLMTQRMAVEHGDRFGGLGVIIAAEPANNECASRSASTSLAFVVGTEDFAIPYEGGVGSEGTGAMLSADQTIINWVEHMGCESEPSDEDLPDLDRWDRTTVKKQHWACPDGHDLLRYRVDGGGHVTPSIEQHVSLAWELLVGEQNHDMETVHELWAFFEDHPRAATGR